MHEIENYRPKEGGKLESQSWEGVIRRVIKHKDDGHAAKLIRAIAHGEALSRPYEGDERFRIRGDMWLKLGNMGESDVRLEAREMADCWNSD